MWVGLLHVKSPPNKAGILLHLIKAVTDALYKGMLVYDKHTHTHIYIYIYS
jgi:hypothetical protein